MPDDDSIWERIQRGRKAYEGGEIEPGPGGGACMMTLLMTALVVGTITLALARAMHRRT